MERHKRILEYCCVQSRFVFGSYVQQSIVTKIVIDIIEISQPFHNLPACSMYGNSKEPHLPHSEYNCYKLKITAFPFHIVSASIAAQTPRLKSRVVDEKFRYN